MRELNGQIADDCFTGEREENSLVPVLVHTNTYIDAETDLPEIARAGQTYLWDDSQCLVSITWLVPSVESEGIMELDGRLQVLLVIGN